MGSFDEWDQSSWPDSGQSSGDFGGGEWGNPAPYSTPVSKGGGGWHWLLTLVAVVTVGLLSMGMAWVTRDVDERPVWMMGLIFMVPAGALMFAAMMVESATSAMTPGSSRKPQVIIAVCATLATLVVACICDLLYLLKFKAPPPVPPRSSVTAVNVSDRLILIADPTVSMTEGGKDSQLDRAVSGILDAAGKSWEIALIRGTEEVLPAAADEAQKQAVRAMAGKQAEAGRMYYGELLERALAMTEAAGGGKRTRIVFLTDGVHPWIRDGELDLAARCVRDETTVSCILFGTEMPPEMREHISATRGYTAAPDEWPVVLREFDRTEYREEVAPAIIPKEIKLQQDLLRNRDSSAVIISFIMLILEGLALGICLSLMLSVRGQFRAQYIISPVMGALAAILLKLVWPTGDMSSWWIYEGISFTLLGVVIMARNNRPGYGRRSAALQGTNGSQPDDNF